MGAFVAGSRFRSAGGSSADSGPTVHAERRAGKHRGPARRTVPRSHGRRSRGRWVRGSGRGRGRPRPGRRWGDSPVQGREPGVQAPPGLRVDGEEDHVPDQRESRRQEHPPDKEREQAGGLLRGDGARVRHDVEDAHGHVSDHCDADDTERGDEEARDVGPPPRLGRLEAPRKSEGPLMSKYTTKIAASVESVVPIHLKRTPRPAFRAWSGPYSFAPWCIRMTDIRATMKLITKTITRPHAAEPMTAAAAIALAGFDVVRRIDAIPTVKANAPKTMSRIRLT